MPPPDHDSGWLYSSAWWYSLDEELVGNGRRSGFDVTEYHDAVLRTTDEEENEEESKLKLKPKEVNFNKETSRTAHRTDQYANQGLIVRRGQEFKITVTFNRPFDAKQDSVILQLSFGSSPTSSKGTLIRVEERKLSTSSWGMRIDSTSGNTVSLTIMSSADALVGEYSVFVDTKTKKRGSEGEYLQFRKKADETIIILFNAWCKDDAVFMGREDQRQEYVLNDKGVIWRGSTKYNSGKPWYFGQFEEASLKVCLYLLEISKMASSARGNPAMICRKMSQMANSNDDDGGILWGRWTDTYPNDSTEPTAWIGSVKILEEYSKTHKSVRYGQCWVFSGLVTTLLRALGIPTRSVTNFQSGRDHDASMTIDYHFDKEGNPLKYLNDFVWNFHVWNESYFIRPDLPPGYDGWQVHDSTPQETSDGIFCCGPCPVKAIKWGKVHLPHDAGFVFGEVNGDKVYWEVDLTTGEMEAVEIDESAVGKLISTKAVGSNDREELTQYYKHMDGSLEERNIVRKVNARISRKSLDIYKPSAEDVEFFLILPDHSLLFGDDFRVELVIKNHSNEKRTVRFSMSAKLVFYTGVVIDRINGKHGTVQLERNEEKRLILDVEGDVYFYKASPDSSVEIDIKAKVKETRQFFFAIESVDFMKKPEILAQFPDKIVKNKRFDIKFVFTNPFLKVDLTECKVIIESSRHVAPDTMEVNLPPIRPKSDTSYVATFTAESKGTGWVYVSFHAKELSGVFRVIEFQITDN